MKSVQKEKKVTVKFFLNQLIEPITGERSQEYYPLYIQVTYNRQNMQLKSKYGLYYRNLKEVDPAVVQFEESTLRKIIQYEARQRLNDYALKGLKRKYAVYSTTIQEAIEQYLKPKLRSAVLETKHELSTVLNFNEPQVTVIRLYKAAQLLFPDLAQDLPVRLQDELGTYEQYLQLYKIRTVTPYNFPTIIDWVNGSYPKELEKKTNTVFKDRIIAAKKVTGLVEDAVAEKLKQLGD